jgi:osmoprotectant transport system substrate-binding protein
MRMTRRSALGASLLASLLVASVAGGSGVALADEEQPTIRIGSDNFYESRLMAEIYSQVLEDEGFTVDRQFGLGSRQERAPAFEEGLVDLVPEYVGSGLGYYDLEQITGDGATNRDRLQAILTERGIEATVLGITEGEDTNAAVVRQDTATELGLSRMSDLAAVQDQLRWGLPPDCDANPLCKGALEMYGIAYPPAQREALFACDAPIAEALANNAIDFAWLCSTQPAISQFGFVVLDDDLDTQPAENLAPVVRDDFLEQVAGGADTLAAALDPVSATISTEDLTELGVKVAVEQQDIPDVAREYLASIATDEQPGTEEPAASPAAESPAAEEPMESPAA